MNDGFGGRRKLLQNNYLRQSRLKGGISGRFFYDRPEGTKTLHLRQFPIRTQLREGRVQVYCCCGKLGDEGNGEKRKGRKGVGRVDRTVIKKKG